MVSLARAPAGSIGWLSHGHVPGPWLLGMGRRRFSDTGWPQQETVRVLHSVRWQAAIQALSLGFLKGEEGEKLLCPVTVGAERYTFVFSTRHDAWHRECFPLMLRSPGAASWIPQASCCKDRAPFSSTPHAPSHPGVPSHGYDVRMGSLEPAFALRGAYRLGFLSALRWAFWFMKAHCGVLFAVWSTLTNWAPGPRVSGCHGVSSQYTSQVTSHSSHAKGSFYNSAQGLAFGKVFWINVYTQKESLAL